ncbi:GntR family transcriptional regulator [Streptococcus pluranimalium]|uniref:GntR family transcriptional regulator n=1 Tax=Streptococcus hyovaginalis TaxID=149015 RepID=UPI002A83D563|nr:GntR family transcriptional regulator [Streptococcus hyovaginalis]MDY4510426.1 GntR family transcriptional regulator [Streptococcus hyovaginalis]
MKAPKIPKYQQLINMLKNQILTGKFKEGDRFHTESDLVNHFNVSSITAIRALNELEREGLVERKQGIGTFVSRSRLEALVKFSDVEVFCPDEEQVTVLSMTKGNHPDYLTKLGLHKTEFYYQITRVRQAAGEPYIYHQSYIPHDYIKSPYENLEHFHSIYQRFQEDFKISMPDEAFEETNEICFPCPKHIAKQLHIKGNEPAVLQLHTTRSRETNRILEYVETYKRWDYYKFKISSND